MTFQSIINQSIQSLLQHPTQSVVLENGHERILDRINRTAQFNNALYLNAMCGTASGMITDCLPPLLAQAGLDVRVDNLNADHPHSFHAYNRVVALDNPGEPLFLDMSIAQFLTKPLQALAGKPYFLGTQARLKQTILDTRAKTLHIMQTNFPELKAATFNEYALLPPEQAEFTHFLYQTADQDNTSFLLTTHLADIWETGWGDQPKIKYSTYSQPQR